ncbi:unnamed protein product [Cuscuta campestris]|uniref:Uncharacterized protein n=1 Tax=Cuscuta campestris TaxID=132261 RepID=A0A484M6R6_9ASTE|nr:unnamed protein product [Cuscuta campestris]
MSTQSSTARQSATELGDQGSAWNTDQKIQFSSCSHEEIVADSVFDVPPGFFAIQLKSLKYGFRFPLHLLVVAFFHHFDLLPCQIVPKSHHYVAGFLIHCQQTEVRPDLGRFLIIFWPAKFSGVDSGSYAALVQMQEKIFKSKDSVKSWKEKFILSPLPWAPLCARNHLVPVARSRARKGVPPRAVSPTPPINSASREAPKMKKHKETASSLATPRGSESPHMTHSGHPSGVKLRLSKEDRAKAHDETAASEEGACQAEERAWAAEERA